MLSKDKAYSNLISMLFDEVSNVIVGKKDVVKVLVSCLLSKGHALIEDYPGLAKTLMAKTIAGTMSLEFKRIQFTSDLLPSDITGSYVLNRKTSEFELRKGPVFTNILLADEINRAPPKTQSALLEAMQERQVTIEGQTFKLEEPFFVIATQNPIEYEGTYPLPEAQVDRFLVRINVGYPTAQEEIEILDRRNRRRKDDVDVKPVLRKEELIEIQDIVERVYVAKELLAYIVDIVRETRQHKDVDVGSSPRGSLALLKLSKSYAWISGRDYVIPDDIKMVAVPALSHRLILKPEAWLEGNKTANIVAEILNKVPVPKVD